MSLRRHHEDPTPLVQRAFEQVHRERMADLPLNNPALRVQAVGFRRWDGHWLGVIVTPWCMSLLLVPGAGEWQAVRELQRRFVRFPYGQLALLHGEEPQLGEFQSCALFSPMGAFASQDDAIATAVATIDALLAPPPAPVAIAPAKREPPPSAARRRLLGLQTRTA